MMIIWLGFWNTIRIINRARLRCWLLTIKRLYRYVTATLLEDSDNGRIYHQQIQLRLQFFPDTAAAEKAIALVSGVAPQY
ncbi:hypothetical protein CXB51_017484 [Gossypium anomalum]|uniref:Uncharacterized protein n=1 Tax=Gossypium anomalum TaxID=47600 RepID=A0A8J6CVW2_9ROSI|nr:hypothetical protein CXB51_017485 [Gossypium anomalum]KAG8489376.1 hypothetical protein CXB51_017484 [Gossypium anomalum]